MTEPRQPPTGASDYTRGYVHGYRAARRAAQLWEVRAERGVPEPPADDDCDGECCNPHVDELERGEATVRSVTTERRTVSATGGEKGDKLARFDLIPVEPLWLLAEHYGKGARKYADNNWRRGYPWHLNYAAAMRHLASFWGGEDLDPETGSPHVIAAAWHCLALAQFMLDQREYDDRPSARPRPSEDDPHRPHGQDGSRPTV